MKSGLAGPRSAISFLAVGLVVACATAAVEDQTEPKEREGQIITREQIARSGARDGWEALRWGATHLNFQYTREGSPVRVTHRGVDSFFIGPQILLIVDGAQMQGLSALESIPASSIEYIQILAARVGVVKYGTNAGNGVVVVKTCVPPPTKR